MAEKERVYSDAEVEARLKQDLPHWYLRERLDPAQIQDP